MPTFRAHVTDYIRTHPDGVVLTLSLVIVALSVIVYLWARRSARLSREVAHLRRSREALASLMPRSAEPAAAGQVLEAGGRPRYSVGDRAVRTEVTGGVVAPDVPGEAEPTTPGEGPLDAPAPVHWSPRTAGAPEATETVTEPAPVAGPPSAPAPLPSDPAAWALDEQDAPEPKPLVPAGRSAGWMSGLGVEAATSWASSREADEQRRPGATPAGADGTFALGAVPAGEQPARPAAEEEHPLAAARPDGAVTGAADGPHLPHAGEAHAQDAPHAEQAHTPDASHTGDAPTPDASHTGDAPTPDASHADDAPSPDASHTGEPHTPDASHTGEPHTPDASHSDETSAPGHDGPGGAPTPPSPVPAGPSLASFLSTPPSRSSRRLGDSEPIVLWRPRPSGATTPTGPAAPREPGAPTETAPVASLGPDRLRALATATAPQAAWVIPIDRPAITPAAEPEVIATEDRATDEAPAATAAAHQGDEATAGEADAAPGATELVDDTAGMAGGDAPEADRTDENGAGSPLAWQAPASPASGPTFAFSRPAHADGDGRPQADSSGGNGLHPYSAWESQVPPRVPAEPAVRDISDATGAYEAWDAVTALGAARDLTPAEVEALTAATMAAEAEAALGEKAVVAADHSPAAHDHREVEAASTPEGAATPEASSAAAGPETGEAEERDPQGAHTPIDDRPEAAAATPDAPAAPGSTPDAPTFAGPDTDAATSSSAAVPQDDELEDGGPVAEEVPSATPPGWTSLEPASSAAGAARPSTPDVAAVAAPTRGWSERRPADAEPALRPAAQADILLVEDDDNVAKVYRLVLESKGHTVRHAGDGVVALEAIRQQPPDLILLDVMMPRMNGILFLQSLRANPQLKELRVVVLSNFREPRLVERAMSLGAVEYVVKAQTRPDVLLNAIPLWLRGERAVNL